MSWWVVPVLAGLGVLGLLAGWTVGTILVAFRQQPMDIWEDWED
jgi:hypothetical protein